MILKTKISPTVVTKSSKDAIKASYSAYGYTFSTLTGNHFGYPNDGKVIAINFIKKNRKTKQIKNTNTGRTTKSIVLNQSHWVGYVYIFPVEMLTSLRLKVNQKSRNFTLERY